MHLLAILQVLVLLAVANGAPVAAKKIFGRRLSLPVDLGARFVDGRPLFGRSKTIRGILTAVLMTTLAAPLIGLDWETGTLAGAMAMAGDLVSSFTKRRIGLPASSRAVGIDQLPESLLPALACRDALSLTVADIAAVLAVFFAGEIVLSRLLYALHLRDEPY